MPERIYQKLEIIRVEAKRLALRPVPVGAAWHEWTAHSEVCAIWRRVWLDAAHGQREIERRGAR